VPVDRDGPFRPVVAMPAAAASVVSGRTPVTTSTSPARTVNPSSPSSTTSSSWVATARIGLSVCTVTPWRRSSAANPAPSSASTVDSTWGSCSTTVTCRPRVVRASAISRPM